ncbi:TPA: reverse transcriptase domain-containing protein [Salmonella enterica subsp. enterica serovar Virchow]
MKPDGESRAVWDAQDALVLKYVALRIAEDLPRHPRCEHLRGHGGVKQSIQRLHDAITGGEMQFVCRTDIRGYYRHIRKAELYGLVRAAVADPALCAIVKQFVYYSVEDGGEFHTPETGISRGCALSPLLGGSLLYHMDRYFSGISGLYYARYMDDIVILSGTRWRLRRAVKALNRFFEASGFEKHPDKTYTGRISHGFDWLGMQLDDRGVTGMSARSVEKRRERCRRLYERARRRGESHEAALARVADYRKRSWFTIM